VSVVILSTENTIHRFPGMVGEVGVIHEVKMHRHKYVWIHIYICIYIYMFGKMHICIKTYV
jgi:hypothetical protein